MIGHGVAVTLPALRAHAESLMAEQATGQRLTPTGWAGHVTSPARRVKPAANVSVTIPPGASSDAFVVRSLNLPHGVDVQPGDLLTVAGERLLVTSAPRHTHMVELRISGVWPATPVDATVIRPAPKDARGNPTGAPTTLKITDAAFFALSSSDPTDLSQVVKTTMRVWCLPGVTILPGDELLPASPSIPYRYIVKGDPVYSPLGVVAELVKGKVSGP